MNAKYIKTFLAFTLVVSICIGPDTLAKSEEFQNQLPLDKGEVFLAPLQPTQEENIPQSPEYARGELIVKFSEEAGYLIDNKLSLFTLEVSPAETGITSINQLNIQCGVAKIEPVLKQRKKKQLLCDKTDRQMFQETQAKFPQRTARAPKGIQPPNLSNIYLLKLQDQDADIRSICSAYESDPNVVYAEPNYKRKIYLEPNDKYFNTSGAWGQDYKDMWGLHRINVEQAWDITTGSSDIVVAVTDTGVDCTHIDLQDNVWVNELELNGQPGVDDDNNGFVDDINGWNCTGETEHQDVGDYAGHGSHVAGTIAACSNNGIGVAGISWHSKIMAMKCFYSSGWGFDCTIGPALVYAVDNGADIINMSWGADSWGGEAYSSYLEETLEMAYTSGVVLVAAAGNSNSDVSGTFPARLSKVIAVAAWSYNDQRASFSNKGLTLDLAAPGVEILSLRADGTDLYENSSSYIPGSRFVPPFDEEAKYYRANGTSMAAPHVSGVAALVFSVNQSFSPELVELIMEISADGIKNPPRKNIYSGYGVVDAHQAVVTAQNFTNNPLPELCADNASALIGPDNEVNIKADIANFGLSSAYNVDYRIYSGESNTGVVIYEDTIDILGIGQVYKFDRTLNLDEIPTLVTIVVNPDQLIDEYWARGNNNECQTKPSLVCHGWPQHSFITESSPAFADLDGDGTMEITVGSFGMFMDGFIFAWNFDGKLVDGDWPVYSQLGTSSSPVIADLDPDYPGLEVVVGLETNRVIAVHADGTVLNGWPFILCGAERSCWVHSSPAVGDLDGDGNLEVVIGTMYRVGSPSDPNNTHGRVYVFNADATVVNGWPQHIDEGGYVYSSPALADLDSDGDLEIIVGSCDDNVYAWHHNDEDGDGLSDLVNGWPQATGGDVKSSPAVADLDGDGELEIVAGSSDKNVYVWHADGTLMNHWPQATTSGVSSSPALADLDSDGDLEIVIGSYDNKVYAWHHNGKELTGWPQVTDGDVASSPAIADIDGDGDLEILVGGYRGESDGCVYVWHHDATLVAELTLNISAPIWESSPAVADLNGDGRLEVAVGSGRGVWLWSLPWVTPYKKVWPMFHHDLKNTGQYNLPPELEPISNKTFYVGKRGGFEVVASDAEDDAVEFKCFSLPQGAGLLQWNKTDINKDGIIDDEDVSIFNPAYNTVEGNPNYDIACDFNDDGRINLTDFSVLGEMHGQTLNESPRFNTASFGWRPFTNQAGTHNIRFMASDNLNYDTTTVKITVLNRSGKPREPKKPKQDPREQ